MDQKFPFPPWLRRGGGSGPLRSQTLRKRTSFFVYFPFLTEKSKTLYLTGIFRYWDRYSKEESYTYPIKRTRQCYFETLLTHWLYGEDTRATSTAKKTKKNYNIEGQSNVNLCCHTSYLSFFYTHTFSGLKTLHWKARKFATKIASRQNSINQYWRVKFTYIFKFLCKITKYL